MNKFYFQKNNSLLKFEIIEFFDDLLWYCHMNIEII
jgi:hypothetical protein